MVLGLISPTSIFPTYPLVKFAPACGDGTSDNLEGYIGTWLSSGISRSRKAHIDIDDRIIILDKETEIICIATEVVADDVEAKIMSH